MSGRGGGGNVFVAVGGGWRWWLVVVVFMCVAFERRLSSKCQFLLCNPPVETAIRFRLFFFCCAINSCCLLSITVFSKHKQR